MHIKEVIIRPSDFLLLAESARVHAAVNPDLEQIDKERLQRMVAVLEALHLGGTDTYSVIPTYDLDGLRLQE